MTDPHTLLIFAGAFTLGLAHAFEVDHMTAVSAFVAQRPSPRQAALFGIKWSVGHGASLLIFGSLLFALKLTLSEPVAHGLERLVGVALLALGCWTLVRLRLSFIHHVHDHRHQAEHREPARAPVEPASIDSQPADAPKAHVHTHADGTTHAHPHKHGSLLMGLLHGAAGTAAFVGEMAVAVSQTYINVVAYTMAFSLGVLVAMGVYAGVLGGLISWGGRRGSFVMHGVQALTGAFACVIGVYWMFR